MSGPDTLPHVDAVMAVLVAVPLVVYLGGGNRDASPPYVVLYPGPGRPVSSSLAAGLDQGEWPIQPTCVGATAEQALWVGDAVHRALTAGPLDVEGRTGWRVEPDGGPPLRRDDDLTPPLWYLTPQYTIRSSA